MKKNMNIFTWMGIFLVFIQSGGCDSSFRERSTRDISRRYIKFDSSNRINRYRILDKKKFLLGNSLTFELDTDTSTSDSESGSIIPLKLTRETFQSAKFSDKKDRSRRISMKERSTSKSVIEFLPGIQISKVLALKDDTSLKAVELTRIRYDNTMQRRFSNGRKNRLSEDRRINRLRENIKSRRLDIRQENNNEERMSNMRFRDTKIRKTFRLVKWKISDFSTPSESSEISLFRRQTRLVIHNRFSFEGRVRNVIRQEANGVERLVRKDRSNTRNLSNLKLSEISMERNTGSKLQQPRHERHLLVPKRELKIPSEEVTVRVDNSRRSRKSIRTNDINHGNVEETTDKRINGRGLQRTLDKRMGSSRRQSIEAVVRHRQNQMALLESGRIRDQIQARKSAHSSSIESSGRIQNRQRTDVLTFSRRNREASSRKITASSQARENNKQMQTRRNARDFRVEYSESIQRRQRTDVLGSNRREREVSTRAITTVFQDLENNNSNRKLRINELHSNRHKDKRFSRRSANVFLDERIRFNRERKLSSENRQLMMRARSKENIPDDLRIRSRSVRNRDRATDTLKNEMRRGVENQRERKQQNVRSDERFSTQFRSQINNGRSILTVPSKLRETRSRNRDLRIRNRRIGRVTNMETRRSIMRLKTLLDERFVKSPNEIRTSPDREIVYVRSIITSPSRLKGNVQMVRSGDKEISSIDINIRNANRRTAKNQRSEQRAENIHLRTENDRRMRKDLVRNRIVDSRNRRSEPRINVGRILRNHRIRDEFKQSKMRVSSDLTKESSVRTTTQTRTEIGGRENEQQQRRISVRSIPKHIISTPKLHSTATNSTFKDNVHGFSVSKFREIVSLKKPIVSSDRTTKLYRSITAPKSSSSNKSFMDFYEYFSEKRSSFISLILNVMLGLAVIVASSDDRNKGFIPRRLTPFVDGFLKYTTVL